MNRNKYVEVTLSYFGDITYDVAYKFCVNTASRKKAWAIAMQLLGHKNIPFGFAIRKDKREQSVKRDILGQVVENPW